MRGFIIAVLLFTFSLPSVAEALPRSEQCRNMTAERTVRCAARKLHPEGGVRKALSVWRCEGGISKEPSPYGHGDSYHGPYQYLATTFYQQYNDQPALVKGWGLVRIVHHMRSNIVLAIGWARRTWSPWSCA